MSILAQSLLCCGYILLMACLTPSDTVISISKSNAVIQVILGILLLLANTYIFILITQHYFNNLVKHSYPIIYSMTGNIIMQNIITLVQIKRLLDRNKRYMI